MSGKAGSFGGLRPLPTLAALLATTAAVAPAHAQEAGAGARAEAAAPLQLPGPGEVAAPEDRAGIPSLRLPRTDSASERDRAAEAVAPRAATRVRGVTVAQRARPDFDPVGVRLGGMVLLPEVAARAAYDGNVFGQPNGVNDVFGTVRAAATLRSEWSRHQAVIDGFVARREYATFGTESATTYRLNARSRLDIDGETSATTEVSRERVLLLRNTLTEVLPTRRPVRYDLTAASFGLRRDLGRFRANAIGYVARYDFVDAERPDGSPLSQRFRSYDLYRGSVQLGYASGAGPVLYVQGIVDLRRYNVPAPPIDRDSDGYEVLAGITSDITPLLRGRLAVGYVHADFKDPTVESRGAFGFDVDLDYLVTELTTVRLSARRYLQNIALAASPGGLNTDAALGADHELLRNLIVSGNLLYGRTSVIRTGGQGTRLGAEARARLFINRRLRVDGDVAYFRGSGSGVVDRGGGFNEVRGSAGISFVL
ncbi:outer membrane beta-barrel protein [Sphingomonas lenta]|uniref:Outer membrane beta-barrel protein n=1 Tax=Sphingomonas lenta TaxID=1141887 RepID=A0A2A2SAR3_9SPHN|nr:outer membrane beta-barrel protein [Sphingomonas lenta]PAX06348.1 hypothetical protein CKY28_17875 [Sphingomonas lenta]